MTAWVLGFVFLWLLHAVRTRLKRAEDRVRELEEQVRLLSEGSPTQLAFERELRAQSSRLAKLEWQLVAAERPAAQDRRQAGSESEREVRRAESLAVSPASGDAAQTALAISIASGDAAQPAFTADGRRTHTQPALASTTASGDATTHALAGSTVSGDATTSAFAAGGGRTQTQPALASSTASGDATPPAFAADGGGKQTPPHQAVESARGSQPRASSTPGDAAAERSARNPAAAHPPADPTADWAGVALRALRELIFGGNTVVRIGILVLLVGVALLLGWAAEHDLFPIELRLTLTALGALGLSVWGVRERGRKPGFALTLQGGGIAALYLVVCFAYRTYELLPPSLAFALLTGLTLASGCLSVLQDSTALIFIAQLFGFAAPILASSGRGSHVALFSYYLLLNVLIFAVAFFKAWRPLNLLGFVFTFGIATAWGALRYEPSAFPTTEPFLLGFFALYLIIPMLFALRHAGTPRGWVDGGLVFGTPLTALALQWKLVHDRPFAMAYSVFALAAIYLGLAFAIQRSRSTRLAALGEAYLPIGVGFATLAIPYGLNDGDLTGAAWALEGAGLYWVGVRQQRWLSRLAGVVLALVAVAAVHRHHWASAQPLPLVHSAFLVGVLLAASLSFIARHAHARRSQLPGFEWRWLQLFVPFGLALWFETSFAELERWAPSELQIGSELCLLGSSLVALELFARRRGWAPARLAGFVLWPIMLVYLQRYSWDLGRHPLHDAGWLGWPVVALGMWLVLRRVLEDEPRLSRFITVAHASAVWLWALFGLQLCEQLCRQELQLDESYGASAGNLTLALWAGAFVHQSRSPRWPSGVHTAQYLGVIVPWVLLWGAWRSAAANVSLPVDAAPLPYLPLLNALDLSSLIGVAAALAWLRRLRGLRDPARVRWASPDKLRRLSSCLGALVFAWWNCLLARSVHHYGGVDFDADALFDSSLFQLTLSLSWTLIAFVAMLVAHRRALRPLWLAAAALLAVVVTKLFVIDLSQLSTPAKIGSFLGVGVLLLLIGYIVPVPPQRSQQPNQA